MGVGCTLQVLFILKRGPFLSRNVISFVLTPGPFCPETWSVLSRDVVSFVLKCGPFCLVRVFHGPFCPSTYATTIWFPVYKKDTIVIENVQWRATKLVRSLRNLSYPEKLTALGLPILEYRRDRADMVQMYKIFNDIDIVNKGKVSAKSIYIAVRGHSIKILKKIKIEERSNYFNKRIVQTWNDLPEYVIMAPSLNIFKSRLNSSWHGHPYKFTLWCYIPGGRTSIVNTHLDASIEVEKPNQTLTM